VSAHEITELVTIATCSCGAQFSAPSEAEAEALMCEHKAVADLFDDDGL
jgi:hypothetical protein